MLDFETGKENVCKSPVCYCGYNRHFQFTTYADVDTYVDTYADLKYKTQVRLGIRIV